MYNKYSEDCPFGQTFSDVPKEDFKKYYYLSQCPQCNLFHYRNILKVIDQDIWNSDEPLTIEIHHVFCRCDSCDYIWYRVHSITNQMDDVPDTASGDSSSTIRIDNYSVKDEFYPPKNDNNTSKDKQQDTYQDLLRNTTARLFDIVENLSVSRNSVIVSAQANAQSESKSSSHVIPVAFSSIEEIKKLVELEPEESFKGKAKKKILEHLDNALKDLTKDGLKSVGKKIFELAQNELIPVLPKIVTQLAVLKTLEAW